jgi:hypothetical protein
MGNVVSNSAVVPVDINNTSVVSVVQGVVFLILSVLTHFSRTIDRRQNSCPFRQRGLLRQSHCSRVALRSPSTN